MLLQSKRTLEACPKLGNLDEKTEQSRLNNTLGNNTIECKKLATIVSSRKNVARPFFRRKQLSTSAEM